MSVTATTEKHPRATARRGNARALTVNIRVSPAEVDIIDRAAKLLGKNRSNFMLDIARREAECVLIDQSLFLLDEKTYNQFMSQLDAPAKDNPRLRRLMQTKAPWEA